MLTTGKLFGRGISFPPRIGPDGRMAWSEGEVNIREAIRIILMTDQKERVMLPGFGGGLARFLFEPNNVTTRHMVEDVIGKSLAQWEPRIVPESVSVEADPHDVEAAIATIVYKLVATQTRERVTLNLTLGAR